jgi:hypothetical protein
VKNCFPDTCEVAEAIYIFFTCFKPRCVFM